jgi:hypothetical protein
MHDHQNQHQDHKKKPKTQNRTAPRQREVISSSISGELTAGST